MKANAPEKIYFNRDSIESIPDDDPLFNCLSIKENDDDIEYIRKDAFIEKACEWLGKNTFSELNLDFGYSLQIKEFVDRFKEYMEGE